MRGDTGMQHLQSLDHPHILFNVHSPDDLQLLDHFQFQEHLRRPDHSAKATGVI